jgi:hypothetical protein
MLRLIREHYRSDVEVTLPLTYVCLPVFRQRPDVQVIPASAEDVRARYLETVRPTLVPIFRPAYYTGWVESLSVDGAGCSIWTNERLLAEEVVRLPLPLRMLRAVQGPLSPLVALPRVPDTGEQIRSLFLYDLYADTPRALGHLLDAVNAMARARGALVLYLLMQPHDPHLTWVRARHRVRFQFPYRLLARGKDVPAPDDRVYIDIRDL